MSLVSGKKLAKSEKSSQGSSRDVASRQGPYTVGVSFSFQNGSTGPVKGCAGADGAPNGQNGLLS